MRSASGARGRVEIWHVAPKRVHRATGSCAVVATDPHRRNRRALRTAAGRRRGRDVGTTTVVAQRVDLESGQVTKGGDRVERPGALWRRRHDAHRACASPSRPARRDDSRAGAQTCSRRPAISKRSCCVGNTCMHHLFCNLSVESLAAVPFRSPHLGAQRVPRPSSEARPCSSPARAGSSAAISLPASSPRDSRLCPSSGLARPERTARFAVGQSRRHRLCLHGGRSRLRGRSHPARHPRHARRDRSVEGRDGRLCCHVIGGGSARGLCGSGLVDAVAAALDLAGSTRGPAGKRAYRHRAGRGRAADARDIRELQLAKGAVAAGLHLLLGRSSAARGPHLPGGRVR